LDIIGLYIVCVSVRVQSEARLLQSMTRVVAGLSPFCRGSLFYSVYHSRSACAL